jgi:hypothetical protein
MKTLLLTTAAVLSLSAGSAFALSPNGAFIGGAPNVPDAGQAVITGQGPVFTTGRLGANQTTTLPGGAGEGLLMNNGNGTSTLTGLGGSVTTVPTPR